MTLVFPITLVGNNLSERHRYLNELVAQNKDKDFNTIKDQPESSAIDRIFKIDLAVKTENLDYVIHNFKNEDMLYVSRALKAKWLLDTKYEDIINPTHLEEVLYPEMTTTAVTKMQHWIHLNMNDEKRNQEFFSYYYDKKRKLALKYLPKCSKDLIANEFPRIIKDVTPELLKLLSEKVPTVAKLFFESIKNDDEIAMIYYKNDVNYFNSTKCVLKLDSEVYLDVIESHYRNGCFNRLSSTATEYILTQRKDRFWLKPELYTAWLLHVQTVANNLTVEECENLVLLLARSKFLAPWFEYKSVEPFIKKLDAKKRAEFKKRVFVQKDVGDDVNDWPYPIPKMYPSDDDSDYGRRASACIDEEDDMEYIETAFMCASSHKISTRMMACEMGTNRDFICRQKTFLDKLFDEYRFKTFDQTLYDLRKKITSESSSSNRMQMLLVLISKSGGKIDHLKSLFELLSKHCNEPFQVKAAVIRSLVKRASVWRVDDGIWEQMLTFAHGLGLDGAPLEIDCFEGLHAVIIRNLLTNTECNPAIKTAYLKNFSTLKEYNLTSSEQKIVIDGVMKMLLVNSTEETNINLAVDAMNKLLDILEAYQVRADVSIIEAVKKIVSKESKISKGILTRLFKSKIGRKELHSFNFDILPSDAAYVNALKHDTTVLSQDKFLETLKLYKLDKFLKKISIYFGENESYATTFLQALTKEKPAKYYARPIVRLIGKDLKSYILQIDGQKDDSFNKLYAADVRANAHLSRPKIDFDTSEWKTAGAKFLANRILICKTVDIGKNIDALLTWKRSTKLAVLVAERVKREHEIFPILAKARPAMAFKYGLIYFKHQGSNSDPRIWESFKPLFKTLEQSLITNPHLQLKARKLTSIPIVFRPEYTALLFPIIKQTKTRLYLPILRQMKQLLSNMDENFIDNILIEYFNNEFKVVKRFAVGYSFDFFASSTIYTEILGRYLLLSKNTEDQDKRFDKIALIFLHKLEPHLKAGMNAAFMTFETFLRSLFYKEMYQDEKYVSCIPMLEKLIKWMQDVLPMEKYFEYYVKIHLTMLHFKAIRQCLKQNPEMFSEKLEYSKETADTLGEIFGRYIARDANELVLKYFDSIITLYGNCLKEYIGDYFKIQKTNLILGVIKGILEGSKGTERRLIMDIIHYPLFLKDEDKDKAFKLVKEANDKQINFFFYSCLIE